MFDKEVSLATLHANAKSIAAINKKNFESGKDNKLKYGKSRCAHYVKVALISGGISSSHSAIKSAKDYGPWLIKNRFKAVPNAVTQVKDNVYSISGQQSGDVVVIAAAPGHSDGHMAMFDGVKWVSDFVQERGFYPGKTYRDNNTPYILYRYSEDSSLIGEKSDQKGRIKICYPMKKQSGQEFVQLEDILAHLNSEPTGNYLLGRNGMWHGGIHITNATTPWCALSGKASSETIDFPLPYKGKQAVRCMADGEVVAYRICRDYLEVPWETGPLKVSGSFVLIKHYVQPGKKKESGLHFYTLYMHLAPWSAYRPLDGKKQWIVNDSLSAYKPEWLLSAGADIESVNYSYRVATIPKGAQVEWDSNDTNLIMISRGRRYGLVTLLGLLPGDKKSKTGLQPGQQYWILVDKKNIIPAKEEVSHPAWWAQLLPPFTQTMQFDRVTCPAPYTIKAGDAVGHLGYFQAPREGSYEARYQVHIECLSMDDNLETFLKNPEKVGEDCPVWLKCPSRLPLFEKDIKTGSFKSEGRTTEGETIIRLSQMETEQDMHKQEYWFLPYANGYVPKSNALLETLSQYDLEKLGFTTTQYMAQSFDHLDGKTPPKGLVREIYEIFFYASSNDIKLSHRAVPYNYKRLLRKIDGDNSPYSSQEYLSAIHNPSYQSVKDRMIVKHPSEWFYEKNAPIWLKFLNSLTKDSPQWKVYSEAYIDKMAWMKDAKILKLTPLLWHMHPVMFLGSLMKKTYNGWAHSPFAYLLGSVESKNDYSAYNTTKSGKPVPHYNTKLTSMSLADVMEAQKIRDMFATGRFQIIPGTLKSAVQSLNLDTGLLYDEYIQDKIFNEYIIKIKRPAIINYLEGDGSVEEAIYDWAKEFSSAGVRLGKKISSKKEIIKDEHGRPKLDHGKKMYKIIPRVAQVEGESYYSGDGLNKAHLLPNDMVKILKESKYGY